MRNKLPIFLFGILLMACFVLFSPGTSRAFAATIKPSSTPVSSENQSSEDKTPEQWYNEGYSTAVASCKQPGWSLPLPGVVNSHFRSGYNFARLNDPACATTHSGNLSGSEHWPWTEWPKAR
jgi:hypothetical protein